MFYIFKLRAAKKNFPILLITKRLSICTLWMWQDALS